MGAASLGFSINAYCKQRNCCFVAATKGEDAPLKFHASVHNFKITFKRMKYLGTNKLLRRFSLEHWLLQSPLSEVY
jgi:hypothetical protein